MSGVLNAMTVDVEEYFQVSAFEKHVARAEWERLPMRVERNTDRILDLFERREVRATFFVLGWIAERFPQMIRRIVDGGHELASHGFSHVRVPQQQREEFRQDIVRTKSLLEDLSGTAVLGYRAASYSIDARTFWALEELEQAGHVYSSSIYPIRHDLYGMPDAPRFPFHPTNSRLLEIPISTIEVMGHRLPCGGGGYFRLYPYVLSRAAIRHVNLREGRPCIFYFHPWEIDEDQPRQSGLSFRTRFRHYLNLDRTEQRLRCLMQDFAWGRMDQIFLCRGGVPAVEGRSPD